MAENARSGLGSLKIGVLPVFFFTARIGVQRFFHRASARGRSVGALVLVQMICIALSAELISQPLKYRTLNVQAGLPNTTVLSITQDSTGFTWLISPTGVSRYDGVGVKVYRHAPSDNRSLSSDYCTSALTDSKGNIWIGTARGLNRYNPGTDSFDHYLHDPSDKRTIANNTVLSLYEDSKGLLWVGTANGLCRLTDPVKGHFDHFAAEGAGSRGDNMILATVGDKHGNFWIATRMGLGRLQSKDALKRGAHFEILSFELLRQPISSLVMGADGRLWVGTANNGLVTADVSSDGNIRKGSLRVIKQSPKQIRHLVLSRDSILVACTSQGLFKYRTDNARFERYISDSRQANSLPDNDLYFACQDSAGILWVGTYNQGVVIIPPDYTPFLREAPQNGPAVINRIVRLGARLVISSDEALFIRDHTGDFQKLVVDLSGLKPIRSVFVDRSGRLWAASKLGTLCEINPTTLQTRFFTVPSFNEAMPTDKEVTDITQDSQGNLWLGTNGGGLLRFNPSEATFKRYLPASNPEISLGANYINVVKTDRSGNLWAGTPAGIVRVKQGSEKPEWFAAANATPATSWMGSVQSIHTDDKGITWFGTYREGLKSYDPNRNKWTTFSPKTGLPDELISNILSDDDNFLWLTSGNKIWRFNPANRTVKHYDVSDGLSGAPFIINSASHAEDGNFWIGSSDGMVHFNPKSIRPNPYRANIAFTGLRIFGRHVTIHDEPEVLSKSIEVTDELILNAGQNTIGLDFRLLNFIKPEKNRYAYRLDGFDKNWNYSGRPVAEYTNIPPGSYNFWVRAANGDGIWSAPAKLLVRIPPPWYQTWWAYLLYFSAVLGVVGLVLRHFWLRLTYKKQQELQSAKLDFFTNISHEIRTHLTLISGPVEKMLTHAATEQTDTSQLYRIKSSADQLNNLLTELMDFRKAESRQTALHIFQSDIVQFVKDILPYFDDIARQKDIDMRYSGTEGPVPLYFDPSQLSKVIYNLLINACKYTAAEHGFVEVSVQDMPDTVRICVSDNGKGIEKQYLGRLFNNFFQVYEYDNTNTGYGIGLALSKSIVDLHGGKIWVESGAGQAGTPTTCFTVQLKKGCQHFKDYQLEAAPGRDDNQRYSLNTKNGALINASPEEEADYQPQQETVLLVEDNRSMREFIREILSIRYNVVECSDGQTGFTTAISILPDLVISDIMMGGLNGLELCQKLKSDEQTHHIPIILLTARASLSDQVAGLETGADFYLTKPFSPEVLELQVRNMLENQRALRRRYTQRLLLEPANIFIDNDDQQMLGRLMDYVESNMGNVNVTIEMICRELGMSRPVLYKKVRDLTGMSVNDFTKSIRLKRAAQLLVQKQFNVTKVSEMTGFQDRRHFTREFGKMFGVSPSDYIKTALTKHPDFFDEV